MADLIIFDLDGTLINSVGGIAESVNKTRLDLGFEPLPESLITTFTGDGAKKLLERSLADVKSPIPLDDAVQLMVKNYASNPTCNTYLYPGVKEGLEKLKENKLKLAVVSNKPQLVSDKILDNLGIRDLLDDNIGGEAGFPLKPAPDAMLYLLHKYSANAANSYIAGDNHTDLNAAANAGMKSIFCRYGFGEKLDAVSTVEVDDFNQLINYILGEK